MINTEHCYIFRLEYIENKSIIRSVSGVVDFLPVRVLGGRRSAGAHFATRDARLCARLVFGRGGVAVVGDTMTGCIYCTI